MTSELHKKNVGKILFSKESFDFDRQDQVPLSSTFTAGEQIHGRAYMSTSIVNQSMDQDQQCFNNYNRYEVWAIEKGTSNGKQVYIESAQSDWTTVKLDFTQMSDMLSFLSSFPKGTHEIYVEMVGKDAAASNDCMIALAAGEFTFVKGSAGQVEVKNGRLLSSKKSDKSIEADLAKIYENTYKDGKVTRAVIIDQDWKIIRNALGAIVEREIHGQVAVKKSEGNCWVFELNISQPYQGGSSYGSSKWKAISGSQQISCGKI